MTNRGLIKAKFGVYKPIIDSLCERFNPVNIRALDLGCGQGEWLELMLELGIDIRGVDIDEQALSQCKQFGFSVIKQDAMQLLQEQDSGSLTLITGFHLAEYFSFDLLQKLIVEAFRTLIPGGLLILELPNSEVISNDDGSCSWQLDSNYKAPYAPQLLSDLFDDAGYRSQIIRLNEHLQLYTGEVVESLRSVFGKASPNYAVIGQKGTGRDFPPIPIGEGNLSLQALIKQFDDDVNAKIRTIGARVQQAEEELLQIHQSNSWIITQPLRQTSSFLQQQNSHIRAAVTRVMHKIMGYPTLIKIIMQILHFFPRVKQLLKNRVNEMGTTQREKRIKVEDLNAYEHTILNEFKSTIKKTR